MYLDVGRMKATLKYGTPSHICSNGYLKTISNSNKKDKFDVCYMARLVCKTELRDIAFRSLIFMFAKV